MDRGRVALARMVKEQFFEEITFALRSACWEEGKNIMRQRKPQGLWKPSLGVEALLKQWENIWNFWGDEQFFSLNNDYFDFAVESTMEKSKTACGSWVHEIGGKKVQKCLEKRFGWLVDWFVGHEMMEKGEWGKAFSFLFLCNCLADGTTC